MIKEKQTELKVVENNQYRNGTKSEWVVCEAAGDKCQIFFVARPHIVGQKVYSTEQGGNFYVYQQQWMLKL